MILISKSEVPSELRVILLDTINGTEPQNEPEGVGAEYEKMAEASESMFLPSPTILGDLVL